jgi:hypothetical protein
MPTNRAAQKVSNRTAALQAYQTQNHIVVPPNLMGGLPARISSFTNTVQTRINSSTGTVSTLGGTLEAQVDRALSQVLRQPASSTQTGLAVRPGDSSIASLVGGTNGAQPVMSPYQASMLREARITQADMLAVLDTLQPLSPFTDPGDVASLQAVVRAEVKGLLEEFSYTHLLPRRQRVRVFLGGLLGWDYDHYQVTSPLQPHAPASDVQALVNVLNLGGPLIPTIAIEDQLAGQQIVGSDAALFDSQWHTFWPNSLTGSTPYPPVAVTRPEDWFTWPLWEDRGAYADHPQWRTAAHNGGLGSLAPQPLLAITPKGGGGFDVNGEAASSLLGLGPQSPPTAWQLVINHNRKTPTPVSFAEKMIRADLLMPVIAQDAASAENALTAVGYSTGEQETDFAWLWSAVDADLLEGSGFMPPPASQYVLGSQLMTPIPVWMTVADILDWAQNLAGTSSTDQLRQAGALGLNLLCDQADELFWLVLALLDPTASVQISALADAEVQLEMFSLATDLNQLANLAY